MYTKKEKLLESLLQSTVLTSRNALKLTQLHPVIVLTVVIPYRAITWVKPESICRMT
jgi:hypothetical protein